MHFVQLVVAVNIDCTTESGKSNHDVHAIKTQRSYAKNIDEDIIECCYICVCDLLNQLTHSFLLNSFPMYILLRFFSTGGIFGIFF